MVKPVAHGLENNAPLPQSNGFPGGWPEFGAPDQYHRGQCDDDQSDHAARWPDQIAESRLCPPPPLHRNRAAMPAEIQNPDPSQVTFNHRADCTRIRTTVAPLLHACVLGNGGFHSVAIFAKDLERHRCAPGRPDGLATPAAPILSIARPPARTLADAVVQFNSAGPFAARNLDVGKGATLVLDTSDSAFSGDWQDVECGDLAPFSRPGDTWSARYPRLSPIGSPGAAAATIPPNPAAFEQLHAHAHDKTGTVRRWSNRTSAAPSHASGKRPLFVYGTVTIHAGGVLVISDSARVFICDLLRMHVTAALLIRGAGPVHIDPLSLETFS